MKKKSLLMSILAIAMSLSLITGATFALFTSESKVNIAIQSATVNVTATVKEGSITTKSFDKIISENVTEGAFENGGTAKFDQTSSTLYLDLLTPGDEVSFVIDVTNNSNVSVKYRVEMFAKGELAPALIGSAVINGEEMAIANGATDWTLVAANADIEDVIVNVAFPDAEDNNDYQNKSASVSFKFVAVQANGVDKYTAPVSSVEELEEAIIMGGNVQLTDDIVLTESITIPSGIETSIDLNGNTITAGSDGYAIMTEAGATLIINGEEQTASAQAQAASTFALKAYAETKESTITGIVYNAPGGTMIINGGTFNAQKGASFLILNNGEMTINGGTFNACSTYSIISYDDGNKITINDATVNATFGCIDVYGTNSYVEINDGTFNMTGVNGKTSHIAYFSNCDAIVNGGSFNKIGDISMSGTGGGGICAIYGANLTINGGSFAGDYADVYNWGGTDANDRATSITVNNGSFKHNPQAFVAKGSVAVQNAEGKYVIVEGAAISTQQDLVDAISNGGTLVMGAGNFTMPDGSESVNLKSKTLTVKGTKQTVIDVSDVDARDQFVTGATIVFEGVTLNFGYENYMGFANTQSLTYKDCTITGLQFLFGETVTFENCVIDSSANTNEPHGVWTYGAKIVNFTGCEFIYGNRAVNCYSDNDVEGGKQVVNFTNCKFITPDEDSEGGAEINSCYFSVGIEVNMNGCTAPQYGKIAYVSQWDSTGGEKTTINIVE